MMDNWQIPEAIFCDRDGTLIEDEHFLQNPEKIRWIGGVPSLLKTCKQLGIKVIIVTNQSGVARGYFPRETVEAIHRQLRQDAIAAGGEITDFYYCPHHPQGTIPQYSSLCNCRKPSPGMFLQGIETYQLHPERCWAIGDRLRDLQPALELGMKAFLVQTGYGLEEERELSQQDYGEQVRVIASLAAILSLIA